MENKYYIYNHINPQTKQIFYIGVGCGNRYKVLTGRSRHYTNYIKKYGKPIIVKTDENLSLDKALELYNTENGQYPPQGIWTYSYPPGNAAWLALQTMLAPYIPRLPYDPVNNAAGPC